MPSSTRVELLGFSEIEVALRELPKKVQKTTARSALRKAALPLKADMESRVRRSKVPPHIAENIVIKSAKDERFNVTLAVGPTRKFFYGFWIEKGTPTLAAQPWARPAFDGWAPSALEILGAAFWKRIESAAKRVAKRKAKGLL